MDKHIPLKAVAFVVGVIVLFFIIAVSCDSGSGEKYYHVPGVSVDVDKRKGVKPAPKVNPAPKAPSFRKR